jgi:hypothetical protein
MDTVLLTWLQFGDRKALRFGFEGHLTEEIAENTILEWRKAFSERLNEGEQAIIIWNCLGMKKYAASAAKLWKNSMPEFNHQIADIWLITTNPFFKMGARTVTMLTKFKLKTASSEDEMKEKMLALP